MRSSAAALGAVLWAGCVDLEAATPHHQAIVGGAIYDISEVPWQAYVRFYAGTPSEFSCGGAVIDRDWVITAAHCLIDVQPQDVEVVVGTTFRGGSTSESQQRRAVTRLVVPPAWTNSRAWKQRREPDIALLLLDSSLELQSPRVEAIDLIAADEAASLTAEGRAALITGWGRSTGADSFPVALRGARVEIHSLDAAREVYAAVRAAQGGPIHILDSHIAAGLLEGGRDACDGDSGSPLVVFDSNLRPVLAGIVSFGLGCGEPNYPGIYTRVGSYLEWIHSVIGDRDAPRCAELVRSLADAAPPAGTRAAVAPSSDACVSVFGETIGIGGSGVCDESCVPVCPEVVYARPCTCEIGRDGRAAWRRGPGRCAPVAVRDASEPRVGCGAAGIVSTHERSGAAAIIVIALLVQRRRAARRPSIFG